MKKQLRSVLISLLFISATESFAQINSLPPPPLVRDRWDTLYGNVDYSNTLMVRKQSHSLKVGNDLVLLGDTLENNMYYKGSYFQFFNTTTNALTTYNYQRISSDKGLSGGAVYTATNGVHHVFFTPRNAFAGTINEWGMYQFKSSTNAITSETVGLPPDYHFGAMNVGFFSPTTNDDSLTVFVGAKYVQSDSVWIFRKHYNQSGFENPHAVLPIQLDCITAVFNFNNEMYVAGYVSGYDGRLLKSSDGITFTVVSNFESTYPFEYIVDADVMNGHVYLALKNGGTGYRIIETPDGTNFNNLVYNGGQLSISSLECFNNTVWYSYYYNTAAKASNQNASINTYAYDAPYVSYLNMSNNAEIQSADTLGRSFNFGEHFRLNKINSRLLLSGSYFDDNNVNAPGTFIYEFIPPVANFSVSANNICAGTLYNYNSQSLNTDSVRWYLDNVNISTSTGITWSFTPGSHTLGLIAISGTQKDTMEHVLNSYTIGIVLNPAISACKNNFVPLNVTLTGAVNPVTYTWTPQATLTQTSVSNPTMVVTAPSVGTYSYDVAVTDANGCSAISQNNLLIIGPNKDLHGAVDVASVPLTSGNVILYKYEPVLTKFDSITYQPLNASGTFTFVLPDAHTYILKCEATANTLQTTYAPSETSWKTAVIINHGCVNVTTQTISVIPLLNIGTGTGVLAGKIVEGTNYGGRGISAPGNPIGGLNIKGGKNPGGGIVAQGKTAPDGTYTLSGLPASVVGEHYFILVDIPGLDTNTTYHRAIITGSMQYTDLDFVVDSAKINPTNDVGIKELKINNDVVKIYPNPTSGILHINITLDEIQVTEVKLFDINGKEVKNILPATNYFNGEIKLTTQLNNLDNGVYFVRLKIGDAERSTRIVVTH